MSKLYSTIYKSVVRAVGDMIEEIRITTGDQDIQYWGFESRADENKWPAETLIGVDGFSFNENQGLWEIRFGLTISTYEDANLLREADVIDIVHSTLGEGQKILLRDPDSGDTLSELCTSAFHVMPMGQTQLRNYRTIGVELYRTGT